MLHEMPLIETIVIGLGLAFVFGVVAHRFGISPLVGYLLAGVSVGPFTPGFVADQGLANELSELGVILLMFGVGLHFSLNDLLSVKAIALPGAIVQIACATLLGLALSWLLGWSFGAGLVFGLALSVASTVVLLRALQERRLIETERGRIAVGWLIVEDLAMVLALVLLPAFAGALGGQEVVAHGGGLWSDLGLGVPGVVLLTVFKLVVFVVLMLVVGRRVIPWALQMTANSGSRELFRLAVLAIALGVAFGAASLFGVSLALGAFFAGMIMSESELSHQAAEDSLPLRDAFAVLFFVSVGMLFDPRSLLQDPLPILATLVIIVLGKSLAAFLIVRAFKYPLGTALTISISLAQIGEFSFILAELGSRLQILPNEARDLILAGAILSILLNPVLFSAIDRWQLRHERVAASAKPTPEVPSADGPIDSSIQHQPAAGMPTHIPPGSVALEPADLANTDLSDHLILVGFGRVGSRVAQQLQAAGSNFLVIEDADKRVGRLRELGIETIVGNAVKAEVLDAANVAHARDIVLAFPNRFEAEQIINLAKAANPSIRVTARVHSGEQRDRLIEAGADKVINGDEETARSIAGHVLGINAQVEGEAAGMRSQDQKLY